MRAKKDLAKTNPFTKASATVPIGAARARKVLAKTNPFTKRGIALVDRFPASTLRTGRRD